MKIVWGALVTDGSGKLGGHVASKNRGGSYLRTKVKPTNAQTPAQMAARESLASFAQGWRGLTEAQRLSFNSAVGNFPIVKNGKTILMSGEQLYIRLNVNLALIAGSPITTAPLPVEIPSVNLTEAVVDISSTTATLSINVAAVPMGFQAVVEATAPLSPGIYNATSEFRFITVPGFSMNDANVWAAYIAKFGTPPVGQKIYFRLKVISEDNGQAGVATTAVATVTM